MTCSISNTLNLLDIVHFTNLDIDRIFMSYVQSTVSITIMTDHEFIQKNLI